MHVVTFARQSLREIARRTGEATLVVRADVAARQAKIHRSPGMTARRLNLRARSCCLPLRLPPVQAGKASERRTVSVIVPTRGRADTLPRTLAPLLADEATAELVVVVDGWDPESTPVMNGLARSDSRVRSAVVAARGGGGAGGRQAGTELARGETLVFVDDDVVAEPG